MRDKIMLDEVHIANNLFFRIESSRILANYKLTQGFTLSELTKTTAHKFSTTAKEIVLTKYDAWFLFLLDVERVIAMSIEFENFKKIVNYIKHRYSAHMRDDELEALRNIVRRDIVIEYDIKEIIKILALVRYRIYTKTIDNEALFDKQYVAIWDEIHKPLFQALIHKITATKYEPASYYNEIGIFISKLLHHTLYEVYEIDVLLNKDLPILILNYDDTVNDIMKELKANILEFRLKKYIEESSKLGYEISTVKLKIYEDRVDEKIVSDIENITKANNLKLIKE